MGIGLFDDDYDMGHRDLAVSSKGNVSATFQVPGMITIPSDGSAHNVTVVELKLNAAMSWVTVPKVDTRTHLKVRNLSILASIDSYSPLRST
jgi:hypothetical protein